MRFLRVAASRSGAPPDGAPRKTSFERGAHLSLLLTLVQAIRWPLVGPTRDHLHDAAPTQQIAWDAVQGDGRKDHTMPELLDAHVRADHLGLDWTDTLQRAIAERATDDERVRRLLA